MYSQPIAAYPAIATSQILLPTTTSIGLPVNPNPSYIRPPTSYPSQPSRKPSRCSCFNCCLWLVLPLTILGLAFRLVMGLIIDMLVMAFWGAATLVCRTWNHYQGVCWRIFVVLVAPFLIFAGIVAAPCICRGLPQYRFLSQTRLEWYNAVQMFPQELRGCCRQ